MSKKRGLGRGINALIPDMGAGAILEANESIAQINIEEIRANPLQPRKIFSEDELRELADSIKEKGVLQPLLVSLDAAGYELIAGERRLRAAHKAGLSTVPVIIKKVAESERHEIALIENIQRKDLNVLEEAGGYQTLIERYDYTQETVSKKLGKNRTVITNALRLLKLNKNIKQDLINNRISMGHARAYLGLESAAGQQELHRIVLKKGLSVRQTEALTKKLKEDKTVKKQKGGESPAEKAQNEFIIDELRKRFATKVRILRKGERGKIIIEFYSNAEFDKIYDLLRS